MGKDTDKGGVGNVWWSPVLEAPRGQGVKGPGKELTLKCKLYSVTRRMKAGLSEAVVTFVNKNRKIRKSIYDDLSFLKEVNSAGHGNVGGG